ncbi:MAG: hypothetical protein ABI426_09720 [Flavobacterium sp.]
MKRFDLDNDPKIAPGFNIPDNYFEQFEAKVMKQLPERKTKVISLWQRKSAWISSVAAVFVIAFGTWTYFSEKNIETTTASQEYLAYESDVTTEDIAMNLSDEDINTIEKDLNLYSKESEKDINEYLN